MGWVYACNMAHHAFRSQMDLATALLLCMMTATNLQLAMQP
jgi:hypothetical protein